MGIDFAIAKSQQAQAFKGAWNATLYPAVPFRSCFIQIQVNHTSRRFLAIHPLKAASEAILAEAGWRCTIHAVARHVTSLAVT